MKRKSEGFFWMSFSDLMTSLFFIMLVLYVLTYIMLKKKEGELITIVENLEKKLAVYELVEQNLKPLKQDSALFRYEEKYKRFTLAFEVIFELGRYKIEQSSLKNFDETVEKIESVGWQLQKTVDKLARDKAENASMKNVSYLVIISGYASHLLLGTKLGDYNLSYQRAYSLWDYWKSIGIDFEARSYQGLIDLQIAGNGWGGVGRFERDPQNSMQNETRNQRFIIQIVPKIGDTTSK